VSYVIVAIKGLDAAVGLARVSTAAQSKRPCGRPSVFGFLADLPIGRRNCTLGSVPMDESQNGGPWKWHIEETYKSLVPLSIESA
jgi:hypothetical protein